MTERFAAHWILSPKSAPVRQGEVAFDRETGRIETVIPSSDQDLPATGGTLFLTPGLVNAHTHLELWSPQPIPILPDESMADWLCKVNTVRREQWGHGLVEACQKSLLEMIRTGTTCVNDITTNGESLEAMARIGMRGVVSPEFFHPSHDEPDLSIDVERFRKLQAQYGSHPLLELGISPHSPYNVTPQAWQWMLDRLDPFLVHTHLAETREEMHYFQHGCSAIDQVHIRILGRTFGPVQKGCTPVQAAESVLHNKTVAAHGVYLTAADIGLLKEKGVGLIHCPRSNAWLSGPDAKMPLLEVYQAGVPVGIGTDSRMSNHDLDLRNEGRFSQQLYNLKPRDVFDFMTHCSADILGLGDRIGRLEAGYDTDMVLWWSPRPPQSIEDPYATWLEPETEAVTVWIRGRVVLERAGVLED